MAGPARSVAVAVPASTLSRRGRVVRLFVTCSLFACVLAGSIWGDDIDFPFGPFRMYASTETVDAAVSRYVLRGRTAGEAETDLVPADFGMRPAEIEGRLGELRADCRLLGQLIASYARRHPSRPPLAELALVRRTQPLRDGQPSGPFWDETVAESCR
jgi:hypothetical protein